MPRRKRLTPLEAAMGRVRPSGMPAEAAMDEDPAFDWAVHGLSFGQGSAWWQRKWAETGVVCPGHPLWDAWRDELAVDGPLAALLRCDPNLPDLKASDDDDDLDEVEQLSGAEDVPGRGAADRAGLPAGRSTRPGFAPVRDLERPSVGGLAVSRLGSFFEPVGASDGPGRGRGGTPGVAAFVGRAGLGASCACVGAPPLDGPALELGERAVRARAAVGVRDPDGRSVSAWLLHRTAAYGYGRSRVWMVIRGRGGFVSPTFVEVALFPGAARVLSVGPPGRSAVAEKARRGALAARLPDVRCAMCGGRCPDGLDLVGWAAGRPL